MDLVNELNKLTNQLSVSILKLRETGTDFAEAEKLYKIKLREKVLLLRSEKGMPVTMIPLVVYGDPEVAKLRFERDIKEAIYNANNESINSLKLQIRVLDNQISREWSTPTSR